MSHLLTSLLDSLHTHLQAQTTILPTLHAQLGLPDTALQDELNSIQQNLMNSVENQVDIRRKEVEMWLEKCETVEGECMRYTQALGGNIKATGTNIENLKKEQVLPRRFEMVTDYQEKLRQLYHTKLEQLTTLTNRLNTLARTLGSDFFASDIIEPSLIDGAADHAAQRDVTPERFSKLEKELVRGKGEVSKRLNQLSALFVQIDFLYTELGMPVPIPDDMSSISLTIPPRSGSSLSASTSYLEPPRSSTPTPRYETCVPTDHANSESFFQGILGRFVLRVEEAEAEGMPANPASVPVGLEHVEPTPALVSWATNLRANLEDTKRRRETHIQAMYDQLEGLWRRLGVADEDMDAFVEAHRGSTDETVREYEEELERMLELKRERMGMFVGSAREEIVRLWDDLLVGIDEREDFAPFADDEHTEELLTIHEDEIRRLKEERRMKAPLLASIKKYFEICEEEKELVAAATDQTRLLGRGPRDPGRLLREEKMRKRVQKEKPRLEQDLINSIPVWEAEARRPFLVHGESILQLLMQTVSAADQENANKRKQGRAGSVPPRATTPVNQHGYAPAKSGVVTPAVRGAPASSAHSAPPAKRIKTGDSNPRVPLGVSRGTNSNSNSTSNHGRSTSNNHGRSASPSKIPSKSLGGPGTSLPRPIAMPVPKPGTQHHALGHGRIPTSGIMQSGTQYPSGIRTASSIAAPSLSMSTSTYGHVSYPSGGGAARKASRARRESFKPRPSVDAAEASTGLGGMRWGFAAAGACVKEEDED